MTATHLQKLLTATVLASAASAGGCIASPYYGDCSNEQTELAWVPEGAIERGAGLVAEGAVGIENCAEICQAYHGLYYYNDNLHCAASDQRREGEVQVACYSEYLCVGGRRPDGLEHLRPIASGGDLCLTPDSMRPLRARVAERLRRMAFLEASAVHAFGQLKAELRAHKAPGGLVRAAARAQSDERRHTRAMSRLARSWGAELATPVVAPSSGPRPLREIALENAVEGCVNETWGAMMAHLQATRATDPAIRAAARAIAPDEARHAAFSWQLHRWAARKMDAEGRRELQDAQRTARAELRRLIEVDLEDAPLAPLGLPGRGEAAALWEGLEARLPFEG